MKWRLVGGLMLVACWWILMPLYVPRLSAAVPAFRPLLTRMLDRFHPELRDRPRSQRPGQQTVKTALLVGGGSVAVLAVIAGGAAAVYQRRNLRNAHMETTGGSGGGKSKFLAIQAAQAVQHGSSLVVIDPHRTLISDILRAAGDDMAAKGTILLWPEGPRHGLYAWNPLVTGPLRDRHTAAGGIVEAVRQVWKLNESQTRINLLLRKAMALMAGRFTLLETAWVFHSQPFREYLAEQANDTMLSAWVDELNAMKPAAAAELATTTLYRLDRFNTNRWLQLAVGLGANDERYQQAVRRKGMTPIIGQDLGEAVNGGIHVLAAVPKQYYGPDRYLIAGILQACLLDAVLRRPEDSFANPRTELYADEASKYSTLEGLGDLLAEARKYGFSAMPAMQGRHQAEASLQDELLTNTRIKVVFGGDHPDETKRQGTILFVAPDEAKTKTSGRTPARAKDGTSPEKPKTGSQLRESLANRITQLPPQQYLLKVRGMGPALEVRAPTYTARHDLATAARLATGRRVTTLVSPDDAMRDLVFRHQWLKDQGYRARAFPSAVAPVPIMAPSETHDVALSTPDPPDVAAEPVPPTLQQIGAWFEPDITSFGAPDE